MTIKDIRQNIRTFFGSNIDKILQLLMMQLIIINKSEIPLIISYHMNIEYTISLPTLPLVI